MTAELMNKISEVVKPITEQLRRQLSRDETYNAYISDVKQLNELTSVEEKTSLSNQIREKYTEFFTRVWKEANVDEGAYQNSIRRLFPEDVYNALQFDAFLVGTISTSTPTPSTELPPNKCVDICPIAVGEITGSGALIAGGGGSYGNCFLRTHAWSTVMGGNAIYGSLKNGVTIPGTFPADARRLRVTASWQFMQEATTFAVLGGGFAETRTRSGMTSEYMAVISPVIFGRNEIKIKTMSENFLLEKKAVAASEFRMHAQTISAFISGNWCYSHVFSLQWKMCEE